MQLVQQNATTAHKIIARGVRLDFARTHKKSICNAENLVYDDDRVFVGLEYPISTLPEPLTQITIYIVYTKV